jgi:ABC-2 type transport system ATP-binding protein
LSSSATISPPTIVASEVSRWYGEVLGLNRVSLAIGAGITSLVGPNGSGKSTLMNLLAGLISPSKGSMEICGVPPSRPEDLHRVLGYCTQHDTFPLGFTGLEWLTALLRVHGHDANGAARLAASALDRTGLGDPRRKKIGAYSKGMRQRLKLAFALAHEPRVLILDEPLNGLDPLGRAEVMALFKDVARGGSTVLISSHILHEVNEVSDGVLMLQHGYVVAEGAIREVRGEITSRPFQVRVECDRPSHLAARVFDLSQVVSARLSDGAVIIESTDSAALASLVGRLAARGDLVVEGIEVADENVQAVYDYLIRPGSDA